MSTRSLRALLVLALSAGAAAADEGMWTFHNPPVQQVKQRYGLDLTQTWLDHVRLASVRFNSGGSGSFVSADGLVLTNHHVALDSIYKLSTPDRNLVRDGFRAGTREAELRCPDLELNVLVEMEDVTARVNEGITDATSPGDAEKMRKAAMSAIEKDARDRSGLRSNVVSLYQGGEYWLYQYRQFTDVRLVFAPEYQAAFFGGDYDNFTYPRYALDCALLRAYVDDKPYHAEHWLKFDPAGPREGDVVFVSGHPARTDRQMTYSQLLYQRDHQIPRILKLLQSRAKALHEYASKGPEEARQAADAIMGIENSLKAYTGQFEGLQDDAVIARKKSDEDALRAEIGARPDLARAVGGAFEEIAAARARVAPLGERLTWGQMAGDLAGLARTLVRYAAEIEKPNAERQATYRDSSLDSLKLRLFSEAPLYPGLEEAQLANSLTLARENLASDDPLLAALLDGQSPVEAAHAIATGSKLYDPAVRRALFEGGKDAIRASDDVLIQRMRAVDPLLAAMEKQVEDEVSSVETQAGARIARARFAILGRSVAPDATFSLRLSVGVVKGYEEDTTRVPWKTTFFGVFDRAASFDNEPPFDIAPRFAERRDRLVLDTPFDFVSTADIIGGNSGSPTLNAKGDLVGLIFDGNIQSLPNRFVYADAADRALSVHAGAIIEALTHVYDAPELVTELLGAAQ